MKILNYNHKEQNIASKRSKRSYNRQYRMLKSLDLDVTEDIQSYYDIIHLSTVSLHARHFLKQQKKKGISVVYLANNNAEIVRQTTFLSTLLSPLYKKLLVSCYSLADRILVPTEYGKTVLRSYGISQDIDVIPYPINLERFKYSEEKVSQFREYFNLSVNTELVISAGAAFERKGILEFIKVARAMPDVTFMWLGDIHQKALSPKVTKALKSLPSNVLMPGHIEGNLYDGALMCANVYFYPSFEDLEVDGVMEAMASSCQVVVRDIPVYRPWLSDKESCYMGETNEEFVGLIRGCISGKLVGTQQAAYKIAAKQSLERSAELMKRSYEKVLEVSV